MPQDAPPLTKDMSDSYNTDLSDADEQKFQQWAAASGKEVGAETKDYDLRGFWQTHPKLLEPGEHGTDVFKKPNHPTFSDESKYHGKDGYEGGHWTEKNGQWSFKPSATNLQNLGEKGLIGYFKLQDPDVTLVMPNKR